MANAPHTVKDAREGPQGWFGRHPRLTGVIALLALLIALVAFFDWGARRRLSRCIGAIRAAGQPTSVEDLIKSDRPIPADRNRVAAIFESAAGFIEDAQVSADMAPHLPLLGDAKLGPTGAALADGQVAAIRAYLAQFASERRAIRAALRRPEGWLEINWSSPLLDLDLSRWGQFRMVSRMFMLEAIEAFESEDCDRAASSMVAVFRLTQSAMNPNPPIIVALHRAAMSAAVEDLVERGINRCSFDETEIRQLQELVRQQETIVDMHRAIIVERVVFLDGVYRGRAKGTGSFISNLFSPQVVPGRIGIPLAPIIGSLDISAGLDFYSRLIAACEHAGPETLLRAREAEAAVKAHPKYYVISGILVPSTTRAVELWLRQIGLNRALQAALACERFRLARGRWPAHLGELVPEYLDAVPLDPFDEHPIRYAIIPEGIKVWCIGEDLTDDNGNVMRLEMPSASKKATDWGWIILNPEMRGRAAGETLTPTTQAATQPDAANK